MSVHLVFDRQIGRLVQEKKDTLYIILNMDKKIFVRQNIYKATQETLNINKRHLADKYTATYLFSGLKE